MSRRSAFRAVQPLRTFSAENHGRRCSNGTSRRSHPPRRAVSKRRDPGAMFRRLRAALGLGHFAYLTNPPKRDSLSVFSTRRACVPELPVFLPVASSTTRRWRSRSENPSMEIRGNKRRTAPKMAPRGTMPTKPPQQPAVVFAQVLGGCAGRLSGNVAALSL
jgi:hypothetical protein